MLSEVFFENVAQGAFDLASELLASLAGGRATAGTFEPSWALTLVEELLFLLVVHGKRIIWGLNGWYGFWMWGLLGF